MEIVEVTPDDPRLVAVWPVMHQLRDRLDEAGFRRLYAEAAREGFRIAAVFEGAECRAAAGYRLVTNFFSGRHLYVDDLVTDQRWRSQGYGRALVGYVRRRAEELGCTSVQLDSGVHRGRAHAFYFREGFTIASFHFASPLARGD